MKTIDKSEWFKNENRSLKGRIEQVENIVDTLDSDIDETKKCLDLEAKFEDSDLLKSLEQLGTYILKSPDVDSCRKVDRSFYETESDYRSRYKIGKKSYSRDFSLPENDVEEKRVDLFISNYNIYDILNISELNEKQVKKVIKNALPLRNSDVYFSGKMKELYEYLAEIVESSNDEMNKLIFYLYADGKTESMISTNVQMSQAAVNKRIYKICNQIINY